MHPSRTMQPNSRAYSSLQAHCSGLYFDAGVLAAEFARRNWARNEEAIFAIKRAMEAQPLLKVTIPNMVDDVILDSCFK